MRFHRERFEVGFGYLSQEATPGGLAFVETILCLSSFL